MKLQLYFILFLIIFLNCNTDHGIEPIRSSVQGVITYSGDWPAPPVEVRLVAATKFPPSGIGDLIIGESIPLSGSSYNYNFYLDPGTYKVVGVAWREQDSVWDIMSICGLYFSGTDSLAPGEVIISTDQSQLEGIDIFVNRNNAKRVTNTQIKGSINFTGTWPDSIEEIRVIATTKFSLIPTILPTLLDISFSNSITPGVDAADYVINAFPGTYAATGVIFFKTNQSLSIEDILYSLSIGGLDLTQYEVVEDNMTTGPIFNIKF